MNQLLSDDLHELLSRISLFLIRKRSGLKAPAEPSCRVPTYIVYFFKFTLVEDYS